MIPTTLKLVISDQWLVDSFRFSPTTDHRTMDTAEVVG